MNARPFISAARRLIKPQTGPSKQVRSMGGGGGHGHYKHPTMDELPLPQGSWQAYHTKQNAKFNRHLVSGIAFFVGSIAFIHSTGRITWNYSPPPLPEEQCSQ